MSTITMDREVMVTTYVNRGRSWASPKANLCVSRTPSQNAPTYHSPRVGFRTVLNCRETTVRP